MRYRTPENGRARNDTISAIEDILVRNELYAGAYDRLWKELQAHRIDERQRGDGSPMSQARAAMIYGWLARRQALATAKGYVAEARARLGAAGPAGGPAAKDAVAAYNEAIGVLDRARQQIRDAEGAPPARVGCPHAGADRNGNCAECGAELVPVTA